jgi:hypothetical protein
MERERGKKGLEGRKRREREEIGGKWLEGGWGEGCAHRYNRGIDQARTQDFFGGPIQHRRRENRGAGGAEGVGCGEGDTPSPLKNFCILNMKMVHF